MSLNNYILLIEFIGFIAIYFHIKAFLENKCINKFRKNNLISTGFLTIHYAGFFGLAVFISFLSFVFQLINYKFNNGKYFKYISGLFIILVSFFINYIFEDKIQTILILFGTIFSFIAIIQKDLILTKVFFLLSATTWLLYGIYLNSIALILYDILGIILLIYSIYQIKNKI